MFEEILVSATRLSIRDNLSTVDRILSVNVCTRCHDQFLDFSCAAVSSRLRRSRGVLELIVGRWPLAVKALLWANRGTVFQDS